MLTGDVLFCQRELWAQIHQGGGDNLVTVKGNQRLLRTGSQYLFDPPTDEPAWLRSDVRETCATDGAPPSQPPLHSPSY